MLAESLKNWAQSISSYSLRLLVCVGPTTRTLSVSHGTLTSRHVLVAHKSLKFTHSIKKCQKMRLQLYKFEVSFVHHTSCHKNLRESRIFYKQNLQGLVTTKYFLQVKTNNSIKSYEWTLEPTRLIVSISWCTIAIVCH